MTIIIDKKSALARHRFDTTITHVVSIGSPVADDVPNFTRFRSVPKVLRLNFDDIADDKDWREHLDNSWQFPTYQDIRRLIHFARNLSENDVVLFHCHAGKSRSTAAAFLILVARGASYDSAWAEMMHVRPIAHPNIYMVKLADKLLDKHGAMTTFVARKLNYDEHEYDRYNNPIETFAS